MVKMGYVWDRTVEFLGEHLSTLMPIVILGLFVPTSISGSLEDLRQTGGPGLKLGLGLLSLVFALLSLWVQLAIAALAIDPALGRRMTGIATARLLPAIGVYLLLGIAILLLCLPMGVVLYSAGFDMAAAQAGRMQPISPGLGFGVFAYALVLMVLIVFVGARLLPLTSVIVAERRGAGAIGRTFRMTRGLTWRLVGVIILYAVVALVAALAAKTVFGSILRLFAGGEGPVTVAGVITAIVVAAVSTGFTVLAAAFAAKLYVAITQTPEQAPRPYAESGPAVS